MTESLNFLKYYLGKFSSLIQIIIKKIGKVLNLGNQDPFQLFLCGKCVLFILPTTEPSKLKL